MVRRNGVEFDKNDVTMPVGALWRLGHKPLKSEGYAYVAALKSFVEANGGKIITDTAVKELLTTDGKVVGVVLDQVLMASKSRFIVKQ